MTDEQLTQAFLDYWHESYPLSRPIQHAINTHVGFGRYLLDSFSENNYNYVNDQHSIEQLSEEFIKAACGTYLEKDRSSNFPPLSESD